MFYDLDALRVFVLLGRGHLENQAARTERYFSLKRKGTMPT